MADDLAQDSFLQAWDKLGTYTGQGSFIGWLLKVAYTTFLQAKRKSKRYAEVLREAALVADACTWPARRHDGAARPRETAGRLTDDERAIMVMSYAWGFAPGDQRGDGATGWNGQVRTVSRQGKNQVAL